MKKLLLGAAALLAFGLAPALAADMAVKARPLPAPIAPVYSWTGWYVGINAGAGINDTSLNYDPTGCYLLGCGVGGLPAQASRTYATKLNNVGFIGGGQAGYNFQFSSSVVAGLEADINYNGLKNTDSVIAALPTPPYFVGSTWVHSIATGLEWFGTVRGRLGFLATPNLLLYGTGGFAYGQVTSTTNATFPPPNASDNYNGSLSTNRVGWTAGAGGEYLFGNWSVKAEYLYVDLGSVNYSQTCTTVACIAVANQFATPVTFTTTVATREHVARVGLNYHFGGPVEAKY
jgi:outer membrane immunogenic protein